jgi:hypothetical protein
MSKGIKGQVNRNICNNSLEWLNLFKNERGQFIKLTKGQQEIYRLVAEKQHPLNIVKGYTRYGKSLSVSLGLILRLVSLPEKWTIVSGTEKATKVIGGYVIAHTFDSTVFSSQLEIDIPLERLKRERSKSRLTFKRGGEVQFLTADIRNKQRVGEALMEFGSPNVIIDGSGLIPDDVHATILRMLGESKENTFLIELGNPFYRNHFYKDCTTKGNGYNKLSIDYRQGIKEGRISKEFIENMRKRPMFNILYECEFPKEGEDILISLEELQDKSEKVGYEDDVVIMGIDVARSGADHSVIGEASGNKGTSKTVVKDYKTTAISGMALSMARKHVEVGKKVKIGVDTIGIGAGVHDELLEESNQDITVYEVNFAGKACEEKHYANIRAEAYMGFVQDVKNEEFIPLYDEHAFNQFSNTRRTYDSKGRYLIEKKEDIKKRIGESPDDADAWAITWWTKMAFNKGFTWKKESIENSVVLGQTLRSVVI